MIVPGPVLVEEIQTEAGRKLYERVNESLDPKDWGWILVSILDIEEELISGDN